jgi:hypothetical protein
VITIGLIYWSIACVCFGLLMAWDHGVPHVWFIYTCQSVIVALCWLPVLVGSVLFFLGCLAIAPFIRRSDARKQALAQKARVTTAKAELAL